VGSLETVLPATGVGGTLVLVILYLLRANATDRKDYQEAVDKAQLRADDMGRRLTAAEAALDAERTARRNVEDRLDAATRELAGMKIDLGYQGRRLDGIQHQLGAGTTTTAAAAEREVRP